jgi:FAD/FMN-containing dehydrogenase
LLQELLKILPRDRVITDADELFVYESDGFTIAKSNPGAVVFPISTRRLALVVRLLNRMDVQIVPRGTGTG